MSTKVTPFASTEPNRALAALTALAALAIGTAPAPARAEHVLQATVSVTSTSAREDLLVPLAFTGPKLDVGARYGFVAGPHRLESELQLGLGLLWTRFDQQAAQLSHGLGLGYLRALGDDPGQRLWVGGMLRWQDELSYLESWDDAHGYWLSTLTLGALLRHEQQLFPVLALESKGELALLGLMGRPPDGFRRNKQDGLTHFVYHVDRLGAGTRGVGVWDLQALRLEVMARFRRVHRPAGTGFGVGLHAAFSRTDDPKPYALLSAGLLVVYAGEL